MVNINFVGRLGNDAEIKVSSKSGDEFLKLRVACNEKYGGIESTSWFDVIYEAHNIAKIQPYLQKGRLIEIHGTEKVSTYIDKNNKIQVNRTVYADRIDFVNTGSGIKQNNTITPMSPEDLAQAAMSRETEKNATIEAMKKVDATQISPELPF